MTITTKTTLVSLGLLAATVLGANSALAFGGEGHKSPRGGDREGGLVPTEMRAEWRAEHKAEFENLTEEEREALREEHKAEREAHRAERHAELEAFTGLSNDELKEAKQNGESMGDVLTAQGITEADAEIFLTEQANEKVDSIVERHDLDADEEETLRARIGEFVQNILDKWFGSSDV